MMIGLTILSYVSFSFTFLLNIIRTEILNKSSLTFIHLYRVLSLVSSVTHARWSKQLNTLTLGRVAKASLFPEVFIKVPS